MHEIVHRRRAFRREWLACEALDNLLANQGWGWCVVPAGQIGGEFPVEKFLLPAASAIPHVPDEVHGGRPHRAGDHAPQNRAEGCHLDVVAAHALRRYRTS